MSPWGEGWAGVLTYLALASWKMDAGTQVLDRSWLELKRFLGNKFLVSLKVVGHRMVDPALSDLLSICLPTIGDACHTKRVLFIEKIAESHVTSKRSAQKKKLAIPDSWNL